MANKLTIRLLSSPVAAPSAPEKPAIEHRRSSKNLEAHRHGVPNFIYNLRNIMEQFFGFASGMTDNQFVSQHGACTGPSSDSFGQ